MTIGPDHSSGMAGKATTGPVDECIDRHEGEKRWLSTMVRSMRENCSEFKVVISYQMPMFKFNASTSHSPWPRSTSPSTLGLEMIEELKTLLPKAKLGRGITKVRFPGRG